MSTMKEIPQQVSASVRRRNPHLYAAGLCPKCGPLLMPEPAKPPKRIRQSSKPLMNKLEQRYWGYLTMLYTDHPIISQGLKFRLANGCWYCPDFVVWGDENNYTRAFEVKGGQPVQDDSVVKIKIAAKEYHWLRWYLVWWDKNQWCEQLVLP